MYLNIHASLPTPHNQYCPIKMEDGPARSVHQTIKLVWPGNWKTIVIFLKFGLPQHQYSPKVNKNFHKQLDQLVVHSQMIPRWSAQWKQLITKDNWHLSITYHYQQLAPHTRVHTHTHACTHTHMLHIVKMFFAYSRVANNQSISMLAQQ